MLCIVSMHLHEGNSIGPLLLPLLYLFLSLLNHLNGNTSASVLLPISSLNYLH